MLTPFRCFSWYPFPSRASPVIHSTSFCRLNFTSHALILPLSPLCFSFRCLHSLLLLFLVFFPSRSPLFYIIPHFSLYTCITCSNLTSLSLSLMPRFPTASTNASSLSLLLFCFHFTFTNYYLSCFRSCYNFRIFQLSSLLN